MCKPRPVARRQNGDHCDFSPSARSCVLLSDVSCDRGIAGASLLVVVLLMQLISMHAYAPPAVDMVGMRDIIQETSSK